LKKISEQEKQKFKDFLNSLNSKSAVIDELAEQIEGKANSIKEDLNRIYHGELGDIRF